MGDPRVRASENEIVTRRPRPRLADSRWSSDDGRAACDLSPHDVAWAGRAPIRPGRPQSERAVAGTPVCPPEKATVMPRACGLLVALPKVHRALCLRVVVLAQFADGALFSGVGSVAPLAWWTTRSHGCSPAVLGRLRSTCGAGTSISTTPGASRFPVVIGLPTGSGRKTRPLRILSRSNHVDGHATTWPSGPGLGVARRHAPVGGVFGPRRRSREGDVARLKVRRAPAAAIPHGEARHCSGEQEYQQSEH